MWAIEAILFLILLCITCPIGAWLLSNRFQNLSVLQAGFIALVVITIVYMVLAHFFGGKWEDYE